MSAFTPHGKYSGALRDFETLTIALREGHKLQSAQENI
jgi:hypothetical protein